MTIFKNFFRHCETDTTEDTMVWEWRDAKKTFDNGPWSRFAQYQKIKVLFIPEAIVRAKMAVENTRE